MRFTFKILTVALLISFTLTSGAAPASLAPKANQLLKCEGGQVKWYVVYQAKLETGEFATATTVTCGPPDLGVTEAGLDSLKRTMKAISPPTQGDVIIINTWKLIESQRIL